MTAIHVKKLLIALLTIAVLLDLSGGRVPAGTPMETPPVFTPPATVEAWRILIDNSARGPISVSTDHGKTWEILGRVTQPAKCSLPGYLAAGYAPIGTVAATAVHGIRIRVGDTSTAYPEMFNVVPTEFAQTPNYFGGHISGDSGIYTDIPAGTSIFRELAPYVGSAVFLKGAFSSWQQIPTGYSPRDGDEIQIIVRRPVDPLREVDFENKPGGDVTATFGSGKKIVVTHVVQPVSGVGRFDGCSYSGVGAINTNHTCVITISTAPITQARELEGTANAEKRGGFQIVPVYHNSQTEEAGAPEVMILGTPHGNVPVLEGTPPLFFGYFDLAWDPNEPKHSWRCEVRKANETAWEPMPTIVGLQPEGIRALGLNAFRLIREYGDEDGRWVRHRVALGVANYNHRREQLARAGQNLVARGNVHFNAAEGLPYIPVNTMFVQYYVDGELFGFTNSKPYDWDWNTTLVADGEHTVEARLVDGGGFLLASKKTVYWVDNMHQIAPIPGQPGS
ncbi:MAG: Ig-like domain-containing protein [Capsulimonadaceae bacterium]|nr:Ig-like domain-containing protein [Capsulimonadaceae bacterium]